MSLLDRDDVPEPKSLASTRPTRQPAGDRVQRDPGPDHSAADHQHLMLGAGQRLQRRGAFAGPSRVVALAGSCGAPPPFPAW